MNIINDLEYRYPTGQVEVCTGVLAMLVVVWYVSDIAEIAVEGSSFEQSLA